MANDLENSIRSAAEKVAAYVDNIATMTVETKYVKVDGNGDVEEGKPVTLALELSASGATGAWKNQVEPRSTRPKKSQ